jgi:hypothetical protein
MHASDHQGMQRMTATMSVVGLHSRLAFSEGTVCLPLKHTSLDVAARAPAV